jgi:RNA polymerase sigma-70 factor (ECF subfamily)
MVVLIGRIDEQFSQNNATQSGLSMNGYDKTSMGGSREAFLTTEWSVIELIRDGSTPSSVILINDLIKKYWKPVYCYLRRKGYNNEQAKDLTQGFFQEVVLERFLVEHADKSRGRFRTFLLTALQQYVAGVHRKKSTQKRSPKGELIGIDEIKPGEQTEAPAQFSPEQSFNYAWAAQLLDCILEEVRDKCHSDGKMLHWQVFHNRVLKPIMGNTAPPSLTEICQRYGIDSTSQASNMIVTVNRRFQACLKRHIRRSVTHDCDVDSEIQELMQIFAKSRAR